jgi:hypothetical protein
MKKIFAVICLLCSLSANAEWVLVSKNELGTSLYVDPNIKINRNLRMFWHIQDLPKADKQGDLSYRGVWQYDCSEKKQRNMQVAAYSQPMAGGNKTEEVYQPTEWVNIGSDNSSQALLKYICSI